MPTPYLFGYSIITYKNCNKLNHKTLSHVLLLKYIHNFVRIKNEGFQIIILTNNKYNELMRGNGK